MTITDTSAGQMLAMGDTTIWADEWQMSEARGEKILIVGFIRERAIATVIAERGEAWEILTGNR